MVVKPKPTNKNDDFHKMITTQLKHYQAKSPVPENKKHYGFTSKELVGMRYKRESVSQLLLSSSALRP